MKCGVLNGRAERIKEERKKLGLTQEEAADAIGLCRKQWVRYENEQSVMDGAALRAFGELGADVKYILTGEHLLKAGVEAEQDLYKQMAMSSLNELLSSIGLSDHLKAQCMAEYSANNYEKALVFYKAISRANFSETIKILLGALQ